MKPDRKIQAVLDTWPADRREGAGAEWLKGISPAHFQNINLRGTFSFPVEQYGDRLLERTSSAATAQV